MSRRIYGEISHYRAPYKNSILSGFGADAAPAAAAADPNAGFMPFGPATEAGKALKATYILNLAQSAKASDNGTTRLEGQGREYAFQAGGYYGRIFAVKVENQAKDGTAVVYCAPNPKLGGGIGVTEKDSSQLELVSYWLGQSGLSGPLEDGVKEVEAEFPRGKHWVYFTVLATGDTVVPLYMLRNSPIDGAACGEAARQMGLAGCELFELLRPGEEIPKTILKQLPSGGSTGVATASMLTYGLVGVGLAAAALVLFARKQKATPNRRKRSRRR